MKSYLYILLLVFCCRALVVSAAQPLLPKFKSEHYPEVVNALTEKRDKTLDDFLLLVNASLFLDLDDAEEHAESMVAAYPQEPQAYLLYASVMGAQASDSVFSALGYAKKAKNSLEKAVEIAPQNAETYMALIGFHLAAPSIAGGDTDEALSLIESLRALDTGRAELMHAQYLRSEDKSEQAIKTLSALSEKSETRAKAFYRLGNLAARDEQYAEAIAYFEKASQMPDAGAQEPVAAEDDTLEQENEVTRLFSLYRIGWVAVESKANNQKGIDALNRYLKAYDKSENVLSLPSPSWAKVRLVEVLLNNNDVEAAKILMETINRLDEDDFKKHYNRVTKRLKKLS